MSLEELRRVEMVIAVVSEVEKPLAIHGVLRACVVDVLVVDEGNAHAMLDRAAQDRPAAPILLDRTSTVRRR